MKLLRRLSYGALAVAFAHIVFGAIVRITGSGAGCGDHWPTCQGYWLPPLGRLDLVIDLSHRWLAAALTLTVLALLVAAVRRRREPGVAGPGGVLRPAAAAAGLVVAAAAFGGAAVRLGLRDPRLIVVYLGVAMATLAALTLANLRAGGLGAPQASPGGGSRATHRAALVAAGLALLAVLMGGLTANVVGANGACIGFPLCTRGVASTGEPLAIHLAHRAVAFLLFFHLLGMTVATTRRRESPLLVWATRIAFGTVLLQLAVAAALVELVLPPALKSLHQAVGTLVWMSVFVLAVLARRAAAGTAGVAPAHDLDAPAAGALRHAPAPALAAASASVLAGASVVSAETAQLPRSELRALPVKPAHPTPTAAAALEPSVVESTPAPVVVPAPVHSAAPEVPAEPPVDAIDGEAADDARDELLARDASPLYVTLEPEVLEAMAREAEPEPELIADVAPPAVEAGVADAALAAAAIEAAELEALEREAADAAARAEAARVEAELVEAARVEAERAEAARVEATLRAAEQAAFERAQAERAEAERAAVELAALEREIAALEAAEREAAEREAAERQAAEREAAEREAAEREAAEAAATLVEAPVVELEAESIENGFVVMPVEPDEDEALEADDEDALEARYVSDSIGAPEESREEFEAAIAAMLGDDVAEAAEPVATTESTEIAVSVESVVPVAAETAEAPAAPAAPVRRPPTLAVLIARGADF